MNATSTRADSARKNPLTTGKPYTGTFRSQRVLARSMSATTLVVVAALIIAPSVRFLFRAHGLPAHDPSGSCESPAPDPHRAAPGARSTDKNVSASEAFGRVPTLAPDPAVRVSRMGHATDTRPACRHCRSRRRRDSGSSGPDYS